MTDQCAIWLYAVAEHPVEPSGLSGVGGAPVRTISAGGLAAVASDVPSSEFGAAALRANLEDLGWLEATAMAHHRVIDAVSRIRPVVPMRLATVYSRDQKVRAMLGERGPDIEAVLRRTRTCQEWGVKAYAAAPAEEGTKPAAVSGADYLRRRRDALAAREDSQRDAQVSAGQVHEALSQLAADARLHPPQSPQLSGTTATMILNASYLVPDSTEEEFGAAVRHLTGRYPAMQLHLTGPWPPYSFATLEQEPGDRAMAAR